MGEGNVEVYRERILREAEKQAEEDARPIHILGAGLSGLAAATILARAGRDVHVHEIREDSGARFDGDFQGIENWTSGVDFFDEMRDWGLNPSEFKSDVFDVIDLVHPDDVVTQPRTDGVAFRIVQRGTEEHTIDQGLKRMAIDAGAQIHYSSRREPEDCHIVAAGPRESSAVAFGEIFHTDHPNHVTFQLNDKLAPGAYSYLIIIDGIGLICTCLWRQQRKSSRYLNETIAWYEQHYDLNRRSIKRVGGKGDFGLPTRYVHEGRYYVGEAGGLQDFMWGFGMRYAITSGVLAAKAVLRESDYEAEVRRRLLPLVRASAINRFLMNRVGNRGFKMVARYWMRDQRRKGDGLAFMRWLYKPGLGRKIIWPIVRLGMLRRKQLSDGRTVYRMPFRKALNRDAWEPSARAVEIGNQWKSIQRREVKQTFGEVEA
ncbi:MAG: NAD(P)-binding protein [Candidatus Thermoplasmatota archaeon]|nr:NAD(P)-binding protein [Candidatus Thermoplasmatota archaeon]